jgi:predicted permease
MLAFAAAASGLLIAWWGVGAASAALPKGIARASSVALDFRVLVAAVAAAVLTGLFAGVVPAWQARRRDLITFLKAQSPVVTPGRTSWRTALLVVQVAFVGLLLVATALFVTSFIRVTTSDLGFERRNLVTAQVTSLTAPVMDAVRALQEVPGVVSAGAFANGSAPLVIAAGFGGGVSGTSVRRSGNGADLRSEDVLFVRTTPGYFMAGGVAILRGRDFTTDELGREDRVILDATTARGLFADADPVGSTVRWGEADAMVVGIAAAVQDRGPDQESNPVIYLPARPNGTRYEFLVRTAGELSGLMPAIQTTFERFRKAGAEPVAVRPIEEAFRAITADRRFAAGLMSIFGVIALFIGAAGIYGVTTSVVMQQTREFGIRVALGAGARAILSAVVMRAMRHLAAGLAIGLPAGFIVARSVESILFGVKATNVVTYVTVAVVTLAIGLMAALLPARRAARVDPLVSLRAE